MTKQIVHRKAYWLSSKTQEISHERKRYIRKSTQDSRIYQSNIYSKRYYEERKQVYTYYHCAIQVYCIKITGDIHKSGSFNMNYSFRNLKQVYSSTNEDVVYCIKITGNKPKYKLVFGLGNLKNQLLISLLLITDVNSSYRKPNNILRGIITANSKL